MINSDAIALKNQSHDGRPLIDYLTAYAPCHLLEIDALVIEHSELPVTIEFVLKTIVAGLSRPSEIGGFLGLPDSYCNALMEHMKDGEYISGTPSGEIAISRKGSQMLADEGDRRIIATSLRASWDPIAGAPVEPHSELLAEKHVAGQKIRLKSPTGLKTPTIDEIGVETIQKLQKLQRKSDDEEIRQQDILRLLGVRRSTLRYRPVTLLLFSNGKMPPIPKLVFDGRIDEPFSAAFAQKDGLRYLGVDANFNRKSGAIAVEDRVKKLELTTVEEPTIRTIVELRASLFQKIENLQANFLEDHSLNNKELLEAGLEKLESVQAELRAFPTRPLNPAEIAVEVRGALESARRRIVITTTLPNRIRFGDAQIVALKAALDRGVKVSIYIADRIPESPNQANAPLAALNQIATEFPSLTVQFLKLPRTVFEMFWDDSDLFFSNDATLGDRTDATIPRAFKGYRISSSAIAQDYAAKYLSFSSEDLLTRIAARPKTSVPSNNRRNKNGVTVQVVVKPKRVVQKTKKSNSDPLS